MNLVGQYFLAIAIVVSVQNGTGETNRCGVYSAYIAHNALNGNDIRSIVDLDEFTQKLGHIPDDGSSIAELQTVLESFGCHCLAVKTSLNELRKRKGRFVCILLVHDTHFVVLGSIAIDKLRVFDFPKSYSLTDKELNAQWNGVALLVSDKPVEPEPRSGNLAFLKWILVGMVGVLAFALGQKIFRGGSR